MNSTRKYSRLNFKPLLLTLKYYILGIYKKFDEDHIWILASGVAFNLLICSIPFILLLFSVLGIYLSSDEAVKKIDDYLTNNLSLPENILVKVKTIIFSRIDEISEHKTLTAIIGTAGLLWTASSLFSTLRDVLNRVYKIREEIFYVWGKLKDIAMVIMATLLFILSFVSTSIISVIQAIQSSFDKYSLLNISFAERLLSILLGLLFTFLMFYLIYKIVPHGKIQNKIVIISSISSTIMWEILKIAFTIYITEFSNMTAIYGAYTAIVAVILWLYYSSVTFVIGAEIGQLYKEKVIEKIIK